MKGSRQGFGGSRTHNDFSVIEFQECRTQLNSLPFDWNEAVSRIIRQDPSLKGAVSEDPGTAMKRGKTDGKLTLKV